MIELSAESNNWQQKKARKKHPWKNWVLQTSKGRGWSNDTEQKLGRKKIWCQQKDHRGTRTLNSTYPMSTKFILRKNSPWKFNLMAKHFLFLSKNFIAIKKIQKNSSKTSEKNDKKSFLTKANINEEKNLSHYQWLYQCVALRINCCGASSTLQLYYSMLDFAISYSLSSHSRLLACSPFIPFRIFANCHSNDYRLSTLNANEKNKQQKSIHVRFYVDIWWSH